MPQYAVKRQELHEGWNEAADEDDDSLDGAEAMVDDDGFDETGGQSILFGCWGDAGVQLHSTLRITSPENGM